MLKEELAEAFLNTDAFKWDPAGGFKLASGRISPFYVDCRVLLAHPGPRQLVARLAFECISHLPFNCIGGLAIGAIPLATAISAHAYQSTPSRALRTFAVRKEVKEYGLGKLIEGAVHPGDQCLVVDDVLTSGASVLRAVAAVREAGCKVEYALVIVDREEENGRANIEAQGLTLLSLLPVKDLISRADARRKATGG